MEVDDLIRHDPHALLGAIDVQTNALTRIVALLERGGAGPRETERLSWGATGIPYADLNLGRNARGFLILNDGTTDAYVALSPARLNAAGALFTIPAGTWLALPLEVSKLCFGGATSTTLGTALVMVLDDAPQFAMGELAGATDADLIGGKFNSTPPTLTDGQRGDAQLDSRGNLMTTLRSGSNAIATLTGASDGVGIGTALAVASGAFVFNGSTWDRLRAANVFKVINGVDITAEQTIWTPTTGKKFRLMGFALSLSGANGQITLRDNTAGTLIAIVTAPSGTGTIVSPPMGNGILSAATNNVLTAKGSASFTLWGFVFGTEE